jgi:ABC-type Fe3+-hydroxamate transport system substrate-binding protein
LPSTPVDTIPTRISAYINQATSLWDFGIKSESIFGWTAANFPEGDHIAWGNVDVKSIRMIGNVEGFVEQEELAVADPELIITWTWNKDDIDNATNGFPIDILDQIRERYPLIVLNQGDPFQIELERIENLATALGADLNIPELVEQREALVAKVEELQTVLAEKPDITFIFASFGTPGVYYVAAPDYVADLGYLRDLGVKLANDGSPTATQYWEELSTEEAVLYPSDIVILDMYGAFNTLEDVQGEPTIGQHPAIAAGQVGFWNRDFPLTYAGLTQFLEDILIPLRTAEKVS